MEVKPGLIPIQSSSIDNINTNCELNNYHRLRRWPSSSRVSVACDRVAPSVGGQLNSGEMERRGHRLGWFAVKKRGISNVLEIIYRRQETDWNVFKFKWVLAIGKMKHFYWLTVVFQVILSFHYHFAWFSIKKREIFNVLGGIYSGGQRNLVVPRLLRKLLGNQIVFVGLL